MVIVEYNAAVPHGCMHLHCWIFESVHCNVLEALDNIMSEKEKPLVPIQPW